MGAYIKDTVCMSKAIKAVSHFTREGVVHYPGVYTKGGGMCMGYKVLRLAIALLIALTILMYFAPKAC